MQSPKLQTACTYVVVDFEVASSKFFSAEFFGLILRVQIGFLKNIYIIFTIDTGKICQLKPLTLLVTLGKSVHPPLSEIQIAIVNLLGQGHTYSI